MPKCIYCLQEKPEGSFNREHVISRMLGTYNNAPVLNHYEVCKDCNTFFCEELENVISLDSYEGLLRTQRIQRAHSSLGRPIGKTRLCVTGQNEVFKGLRFLISTNPNNQGNIQIEVVPAIGIVQNEKRNEYSYYQLDSIPECSEEIINNLKESKHPIVVFGYDEEEVFTVLSSKGYNLSNATYSKDLKISDITEEKELSVEIRSKIDNLLTRLAAKNMLNYFCYMYGKEFVLDNQFDSLREFIRHGNSSESIRMLVNSGGLTGIPEKVVDCHIIGSAWAADDDLYLCGFASWFGSITYSFLIKKWPRQAILPEMPYIICDNHSRDVIEGKHQLFVRWPNSKYDFKFLMY